MLGFTQYGSRLFGIDASSDPTKFQDDWPSGSPLIGAWSMTWHQCEKIVKNWHQAVKWAFFRPKVDFNDFWPAKSIQRVNIYGSGEFEGKLLRSHFRPIT